MNKCQYCHKSVSENQVICMNCGSQVKPLEIKRRFFGSKRNTFLFIHHTAIPERILLNGKTTIQKHGYVEPNGNMTLDRWL